MPLNDLDLVKNAELELATQLSPVNHVLEFACSCSGCRATEVRLSDLHVWLDLALNVAAQRSL